MSTPSSSERVDACQRLLAHAWMVRTFIKHCEESEDFPELMEMAREIFDLCRALENKVDAPDEYLRILRKKLPRFRAAVVKFAADAPLASTHMNFQQAAASIAAVALGLSEAAAIDSPPAAVPGKFVLPGGGQPRGQVATQDMSPPREPDRETPVVDSEKKDPSATDPGQTEPKGREPGRPSQRAVDDDGS